MSLYDSSCSLLLPFKKRFNIRIKNENAVLLKEVALKQTHTHPHLLVRSQKEAHIQILSNSVYRPRHTYVEIHIDIEQSSIEVMDSDSCGSQ